MYIVKTQEIYKVGFIKYIEVGDGTVEILYISVAEEYRRQGYGNQLLSLMYDNLNKDIKSVYVFTRITNEQAKGFYLTNGFVQQSIISEFYKTGSKHAILYVKSH